MRRQLQGLLDGLYHLILALSVDATQFLVDPALFLLEHALGLLDVFDEGCFLFFQKNGRLYKLLSFLLKVPYQNTLRSCGPKSVVVVQDIVDVFGVADVDLMGFSEEGIVPNFDKGIIANAEKNVRIVLKIDGI